MFEFQHLLGQKPRGIALQTRLGTDIPNQLGMQLTTQHVQRDELLVKTHGATWQRRRSACGEYNCTGHVWASRRTGIFDSKAWETILVEDGYRKTEHPQADDLAAYYDQDGQMLHVGRVVELRPITPGASSIPWIVSKWADFTGEYVHNANHHPFNAPGLGFRVHIVYWTDRPEESLRVS
jgi:hypothetical protein